MVLLGESWGVRGLCSENYEKIWDLEIMVLKISASIAAKEDSCW